MKSALILLSAIVSTFLAIPARSIPVTFGYADQGLSLKGVKPFKLKQTPENSKSSRSLKMRGIEALGDMLYPDALNYFKQAFAASNDPQERADLRQYIYTTLRLGGGGSWAMTFPEKAIAMLNEAISMNPNDSWLYSRKGDAYCNMGKLAPCLANHNIAIKLNPSKAEAFGRLAIALVHVDPIRSAKAFDLSANLYRKQGNFQMVKVQLAAKSAFGL